MQGLIDSKYFNAAALVLLVSALFFLAVFMFSPELLGVSSADGTTAYETKIFNKDEITSINIDISEEDWSDMMENPLAEEYHRCNVTINGKVFSSVGIRTKGMTSLSAVANSDSDRYSFKLKADEYVGEQSFFGLEELVINNMYQDNTYMKEYLAYDMMDFMGVPTPLFAFAEIRINGEAAGLYLVVEAIEEDFAARVFGDDFGELYKPESLSMGAGGNGDQKIPAADGQFRAGKTFAAANENAGDAPTEFPGGGFGGFSGGGADLVYTDDNISSYSQIFDNTVFKSTNDADKRRVIEALRNLNAGNDLETYVDVDETLRYFAVNTYVVNLDSYVSNLKHNYYLYEKDGQISILPWDYNLAFAGFQGGTATAAVNFPIDTPVSGVSLSERPLIGVFLENDEYRTLYHDCLQEITDGYFNSGRFNETVTALDALIGGAVKNDPTAFCSYEEYQKGVETLRVFGQLRAESVSGQLNGTIPTTAEEQSRNEDLLVDASSINLSDMGTQGGGPDGRQTGSEKTTDGQTAGAMAPPGFPAETAAGSGIF